MNQEYNKEIIISDTSNNTIRHNDHNSDELIIPNELSKIQQEKTNDAININDQTSEFNNQNNNIEGQTNHEHRRSELIGIFEPDAQNSGAINNLNENQIQYDTLMSII